MPIHAPNVESHQGACAAPRDWHDQAMKPPEDRLPRLAVVIGLFAALLSPPMVVAQGAGEAKPAVLEGPAAPTEQGFTPLFPKEGVPEGWTVRAWDDVKNPGPEGAAWRVKDGVLHGSDPRGTWLVSEREYADFTLKFEFKLGERGNSGCGLRFPGHGDPAFDGLELQMVDPRYYPAGMVVPANELTGSLYRSVAPTRQLLKPMEWNSYEVTCKGSRVRVVLNGVKVVDADLTEHKTPVTRHNGQPAVSLSERPRKGHIGFQELSRAGGHVEIRNARIQEL